MSKLNLKIITPLGNIFEGEANEIIIPTTSGIITVLPNHIPLVSILSTGELLIKTGSEIVPFAISGGVLEVRKTTNQKTDIIVLTERSESGFEIDVERAEDAYKRAQEVMDGVHREHSDFARFEAMMDKELNRVHIGKKYR